MKLTLRTGTYNNSGEPLQFESFEIACTGTGTEDDPVIINSLLDLPDNFEIIESEIYITIDNCQFNQLVLGYCKYITLQHCSFRSLFLYDCSDIKIERCTSNFMNLYNCHNCILLDSKFDTEFKLFKCYKNTINNCTWDIFFDSNNLSRENKIENIGKPWIEDVLKIQKPSEKVGNFFSVTSRKFLKDIECKGIGNRDEPVIIDQVSLKKAGLKDLTLSHNRHYVIIKNLNLKEISLFDTKHVTLENCDLSRAINLKFCFDINVNRISAKKLKFGACQDIHIQNSSFNEIESYKGYESSINLRNCTYRNVQQTSLNYLKKS